MGNMYERILALCNEKGIKPGRICTDTGLSRGMMTDLKMGRTKELSAKNTRIIADYLGVTTDYLLGTEIEKKPTPVSESGPLYPPGYDQLTPANKAIVDRLIADLAKNQSSD